MADAHAELEVAQKAHQAAGLEKNRADSEVEVARPCTQKRVGVVSDSENGVGHATC